MQKLYVSYKSNPNIQFYIVYVNEAHPVRTPGTEADSPEYTGIGRHRHIDDKILAASRCMKGLNLTLPVLIDAMDGAAEKAYRGRPAATAVVDLEGKIRFHSNGPWGAKPTEARVVIKELLAKGGFPPKPPPAVEGSAD